MDARPPDLSSPTGGFAVGDDHLRPLEGRRRRFARGARARARSEDHDRWKSRAVTGTAVRRRSEIGDRMKVLVPVKRVIDFNVTARVKADESGVDLANAKMSMNPFDE